MSAQQSSDLHTPPRPSATDRASEFLMDGCDAVEDCVQRHPTAAVLTCFGVAFGIGMLIGHALGEPFRQPETYSQRWRRKFQDSLGNLPESITRHMHR